MGKLWSTHHWICMERGRYQLLIKYEKVATFSYFISSCSCNNFLLWYCLKSLGYNVYINELVTFDFIIWSSIIFCWGVKSLHRRTQLAEYLHYFQAFLCMLQTYDDNIFLFLPMTYKQKTCFANHKDN